MRRQNLVEISNPTCGGVGSGASAAIWASTGGNTKMHAVLSLGAATEVLTVTALQATDDSGTGSKQLLIGSAWSKPNIQTNYTSQGSGASVLITSLLVGTYIFEFDTAWLDINNGFNHVRLVVSGSTSRAYSISYMPMSEKVIF